MSEAWEYANTDTDGRVEPPTAPLRDAGDVRLVWMSEMQLAQLALLPSQVAAAVQAEREACAEIADVTATGFFDARTFTAQKIAAAIRARGPSDALADALRQAEARGMREAAEVLKGRHWDSQLQAWEVVERGVQMIIAAADAKEKNDGEA